MREETEIRPKPMVAIGDRPILLHLIEVFHSQGFSEFVVLAGYKANQIKDYFASLALNICDIRVAFDEFGSGEVTYGSTPQLLKNLSVSVLDTGVETLTGERLLRAREYIGDQPFLATYGDGLAHVNLRSLISAHEQSGLLATMTVTRPENRFGIVDIGTNSEAAAFREKPRMEDWVNMGFFVFEPGIFEMVNQNESLEEGPLTRLTNMGQLNTFPHNGFWQPMDTYREVQMLQALWSSGKAPWLEAQ